MRILQGHQAAVRCLAYAPDGTRLASGSDDQTIRLWDLATGREVLTLAEQPAGVEVLAFAPDGQALFAGTANGYLMRWDLATHTAEGYQAHADGVRCLALTPDGQTLATAGWDRLVRLRDARNLELRTSVEEVPAATAALAFLSHRGLLALGGDDGVVRLIDPYRRRVVASFPGQAPVLRLACSPDGLFLAAGDATGAVTLWDVETSTQRATFRGHTWAVYGLAFSPDGSLLLSGGADGTVYLWDVAGGRERDNFRWHTRWVTCVAFAPDGMTAAAGSEDRTVVVWDVDI